MLTASRNLLINESVAGLARIKHNYAIYYPSASSKEKFTRLTSLVANCRLRSTKERNDATYVNFKKQLLQFKNNE